MEQYIIAQTVACDRVVLVVGTKRLPVVVQLLWAKYEHALVAVLVILYHCKGCECLTKSDTICKDATVVFFEFVDDGKGSIFLEVIKLVPYDT